MSVFFRMIVKDTFHLKDGRTLFVGAVETKAKIAPPCDCEVLVGGEVKASIRIDGEDIPKGKGVSDRVVSTSQQIDLASLGITKGGFEIRSKA
jgi:hypothetical protein